MRSPLSALQDARLDIILALWITLGCPLINLTKEDKEGGCNIFMQGEKRRWTSFKCRKNVKDTWLVFGRGLTLSLTEAEPMPENT